MHTVEYAGTEDGFYRTLERYGLKYKDWSQPVSKLHSEVLLGEAKLKEVVFEGKKLLGASRVSAWTRVTYLDHATQKTYRLGERSRKFKNGSEDRRFEFLDVLSETVRCGEQPFMTSLRSLIEEAEFIAPNSRLLMPCDFWDGDIVAYGTLVTRSKGVRTLRRSRAFEGMISEAEIHQFDYTASAREFGDGGSITTEDEYDVETLASWRLED